MCSQFPFEHPWCCVNSAQITIKWTQRQLRSEKVIISNLTMNFHHNGKTLKFAMQPRTLRLMKTNKFHDVSSLRSWGLFDRVWVEFGLYNYEKMTCPVVGGTTTTTTTITEYWQVDVFEPGLSTMWHSVKIGQFIRVLMSWDKYLKTFFTYLRSPL